MRNRGGGGGRRRPFATRTVPVRFNSLPAPAGLLLVVCFVLPIGFLFWYALFVPEFTLAHIDRFLGSSAFQTVLRNTFVTAAIVTGYCLLFGYPFAAFIAFQPPERRMMWLYLILIPMWMSILIRTYAWMVLLGRTGLVNQALQGLGFTDAPVRLLFTTGAVHLAMVQILLPLMIVTLYAGMSQIDLTLLRAARTLGASPAQAFVRIYVPLSLGGVISGCLVTFVLSLAFFATPALLGGPRDVLIANVIASLVDQNNLSMASTLAIILFLVTIAVLGGFALLSRILARRVGA